MIDSVSFSYESPSGEVLSVRGRICSENVHAVLLQCEDGGRTYIQKRWINDEDRARIWPSWHKD